MTRSSQARRFEDQGEMFAEEPAPFYRPDPEKVRKRLHRILAEARETSALPWDGLSLYRVVFPQMTEYLPTDEGEEFRSAFETELRRLGAG
jgi:hypothetical protein